MAKIGRNDPCPCGSGKKYKRCCMNIKPRENIVIVGSPERLRGFQYVKDKMEFRGITLDGRVIDTAITYSQTQYTGNSGKEKIISRVNGKVIPDQIDLLRHLSSFGLIVGIDTNTKVIGGENVSFTGVIHCVIEKPDDTENYTANFPWHGVVLFKNSPKDIHPEKFAWVSIIDTLMRNTATSSQRIGLVTDHDMSNHGSYNRRELPVLGTSYLPGNMTLFYGRGDGSTENILNYIIKHCDKESSEVLHGLEETGYYQIGEGRITVEKIPVAVLKGYDK
jgi:hypothetical protein